MLAHGLLLALATSLTPAVDLRWDAPAGCPAKPELERQIAALLAGRAPPEHPPRVAFRVERSAGEWQLHGEIDGPAGSGRRHLSAATCGELVEAAALIVAIAVDPSFVPGEPAVPPAPPPAEPTPPEPTPPIPPEPAPPDDPPEPFFEDREPYPLPVLHTSRPRRPELLLGLSAGLGLGALPAPAGLLRLVLGLQGRLWSAALVGDLWLPRDGFVPAAPAYGGRFWLGSAGLRGCAIAPLGRVLALPVCATLALGVHSGTGIGAVTQPRHQVSPWLGLALGPGLHLRISPRVRLALSVELLAILARPNFQISGRGTACCDDRLGAQFTAGVHLLLPGKRR